MNGDLDLNPVEVARTSDFEYKGEVSCAAVLSHLTPEQDALLQSAETVIVSVIPRATKA